MQIDRCGSEDVDRVLAIGARVFDRPPRRSWTDAFLTDAGNLLLVASSGTGEPLGMLSATRLLHPDKPPELYVREVGVETRHRRTGIGAALVRAALDHAPRMGCAEVWLATEVDNVAACGLYDHLAGTRTDGVVLWSWPIAQSGLNRSKG